MWALWAADDVEARYGKRVYADSDLCGMIQGVESAWELGWEEEPAFDDVENDEEDWECAYPDKCLMPSPSHHRSECYTVADMEAYYAEVEGLSPQRC